MATSELQSRITGRAQLVAKALLEIPRLSEFIDDTLPIPKPYVGSAEIRLVVLGQDPTVKAKEGRTRIMTSLNLDRRGSMVAYLGRICRGLGLELKSNVYATNFAKNFFVRPPTQISELDVLRESAGHWLPLIREELDSFPEATVISLGEPVLSVILVQSAMPKLRDYWGYRRNWRDLGRGSFSLIHPNETVLDREVFPFPHQPSLRKDFYKKYLDDYISFVAQQTTTSDA